MNIDKTKLNHPRPNFSRKSFIDLNGKWDFLLEDKDVGEREPRFKSFPEDHLTINVPYCYQCELSGINIQKKYETVWYQKDVKFDNKDSERVLLHFEGSDYRTRVYINEKLVGEHKGGYTSFVFDITDYLLNGFAHIAVRCDDTYDLHQPRGKQKWRDEPFGCWYQEVTGIWKSVWAEIVSDVYVESFKLTPKEGGIAQVEVKLNKPLENEIEVSFAFANETVGKVKSNAKLGYFKEFIQLNKVMYWDIDNPNLYDVSINVLDKEKVIDVVSSIFGYRFIKTSGKQILLNNKPLFMKLTLEQGYYPKGIYTFENVDEMINEVMLIQNLGFNGLRMHQKIEDNRFYYLCDLLGLIVWCEMPSCYDFDEDTEINVYREWKEVLAQHYNHPSILVWTPINESWGVPGIRHNKEQHQFLINLYDMTKEFDSTRLVVSNDGWEHCKTDLVTLHNYIQDPKRFKFYCDNIMDIVLNNKHIDDMNVFVPFSDGFKYEGQPILWDEFCGIGYDKQKVKDGWGYGGQVKSDDEFLTRYQGLVDAASTCPDISGWCMTQISDVYQEINGLVTFDRKPKVNINKLYKIHKQQ